MSDFFEKTDKNLPGDFNREPEVPEFIIENDDDARTTVETDAPKKTRKKWLRRILKALAMTDGYLWLSLYLPWYLFWWRKICFY